MWCQHCRQDVPGVAGAAPNRRSCLRCGRTLDADSAATLTAGIRTAAAHGVDLGQTSVPRLPKKLAPVRRLNLATAPALDSDDWELEQSLADLGTLAKTARGANLRIDQPPSRPIPIGKAVVATPVTAMAMTARPIAAPKPDEAPLPRRGPSILAWTFLAIGLMAFVCGGLLLAWSFVDGRPRLWELGMPITVVGQVGLLLGLVLQLERIWQGSRDAADKLEEVDAQLSDLRESTNLLGVNHAPASHAFYTHLAEGAPPSMLLADLKSQLDLLAVKMAERR